MLDNLKIVSFIFFGFAKTRVCLRQDQYTLFSFIGLNQPDQKLSLQFQLCRLIILSNACVMLNECSDCETAAFKSLCLPIQRKIHS